MACLALKRSLEWESPTHNTPKRRRCDPLDQGSAVASTTKRKMRASRLFPQSNASNEASTQNKENLSNGPENAIVSSRKSEKGLFTIKQVQSICNSMLQQREEEIREEYDEFLKQKLAEQYDIFVKFTHDQIQKQFVGTPSYLS